MATDPRPAPPAEFDLDEPGFHGVLRIETHSGSRHVVLSGVRPDGSETSIQKDVPASRDERLAELVEGCLAGQVEAAAVLAHLGVVDPS